MTSTETNESINSQKHKRRRIQIVVGVAMVLLAGIGGGGYWMYRLAENTVCDAYGVWWAADLVIEHMERHNGAWPRSWDELKATEAVAHKGTTSTNRDGTWIAEFRPRASIEELQDRVVIDFRADPVQLAKASWKSNEPPFRVIYLRSGKSTHYSGKEPNEMILEYLEWKKEKQSR